MAQDGGAGGDDNLPPPPPVHPALLEILRRSEESQQAQNQIMQALVQNMGGQGHGGQRQGYSAFMATGPSIFRGSKEPLDADFWLRAIEQKFGLIQCNDQEKVNFAAHQLRDAAGAWWHGYMAQVAEGHQVTWAEFREAFRDYHIPKSVLNIKRDEFRRLRQGNKSVMEYVNTFNYLAQYALEDVNTDVKKQDRFIDGLSLKLQSHLSTTDFHNFNDMVSKAIKAEYKMNTLENENRRIDVENRKRAASSSSTGGGSQRPRIGPSPPPPRATGFGAPQAIWMPRRPPAPQGQPPCASGQPGGGGGNASRGPCFNCGGQGHYSRECPSPKKNRAGNAPNSQAPTPRQATKDGQNSKRGKLNHITAEETKDDVQVLVGMVSVNSKPTRALFDSGASHSFMSRKFALEHNFPIRNIPNPFVIDAPGATLVSKEVVNLAQLEVSGLIFMVNLVVIDLEDLDVIIGMNWMTKHDGIIRCNPHSIEIRHLPESGFLSIFMRNWALNSMLLMPPLCRS